MRLGWGNAIQSLLSPRPHDPGVQGSTSKSYSKSNLITLLKDLESSLLTSKILPLKQPFGNELSNNIILDSDSIQTISDHQPVDPLQFFEITSDETIVQSRITNQTYISFANQLFFIKHLLSEPLFSSATQYQSMSCQEVDAA